jgi:hypothetical protein
MASVRVRLLIFSGRPDPEWVVEGESMQALLERARAAVGREPAYPPQPGGLGYRGFVIHHQDEVLALPRELVVFHGVVTEGPGPRPSYWRDVSGLESWLLDQARRQGYGEILAAAGVQAPDGPHPG